MYIHLQCDAALSLKLPGVLDVVPCLLKPTEGRAIHDVCNLRLPGAGKANAREESMHKLRGLCREKDGSLTQALQHAKDAEAALTAR